jgi:hypothetical protein
MFDVAAGTDCADRDALGDGLALANADGPEVDERGGVAVVRLDRHRAASSRHRSGERHGAGGRRDGGRPGGGADVDATVLPGRVRVRAEDERL